MIFLGGDSSMNPLQWDDERKNEANACRWGKESVYSINRIQIRWTQLPRADDLSLSLSLPPPLPA